MRSDPDCSRLLDVKAPRQNVVNETTIAKTLSRFRLLGGMIDQNMHAIAFIALDLLDHVNHVDHVGHA